MAYDLKHTGEAVDAAVNAVESGSVVTENTVKEVTLGEAKPASADAIAKELQDKVDKVEGKGLSSNDYTDGEKAMVNSVRDGSAITKHADKVAGIIVDNTDSEVTPEGDKPVSGEAVSKALTGKVDKEDGKGLSTNDYTDSEMAQVAKIKGKQDTLTLTVKDNGNIVLGNIAGRTKEFMPATPSGDPMHYKYLKVYGLTYDENTGLWSYRASEGGLTDLTTDEVANMYIVGGSPGVQNNAWCRWANYIANRYPARMNMFSIFHWYEMGLTSFMNYSLAFSENTKIKVAVVTAQTSLICQPNECAGMFRKAQNLERIIGIIDLSQVTATGTYNIHMFGFCNALRDVNIVKLKASIHFGESPLLSKQSLLGLIQNAIPTSAITITLHAEAYARLANDADILAALAAQPNITLISA